MGKIPSQEVKQEKLMERTDLTICLHPRTDNEGDELDELDGI